jgi:DNA-binding PadR family transcriptional regulator
MRILEAGIDLQGTDDRFHGFLLATHLSDDGGRVLTAHGTLYKALGRLTDAGLLDSEWEDPGQAAEAGRPRRRLYRVTPEGAVALAVARSLAQPSAAPSTAAAAQAGGVA